MKQTIGLHVEAKQLKLCLTDMKFNSLHATLDSLSSDAAASEIQHKLKPFLGSSNKLRQGLAPLPALRQTDGSACKSATEILDRWISFFAEMEGGNRCSFQDLHAMWRQSLASETSTFEPLRLSEVPSLCALEASCRRVKAGKASGPDGVPSELCKHFPIQTAKMLFALMLKLVAFGHEKGGEKLIWP